MFEIEFFIHRLRCYKFLGISASFGLDLNQWFEYNLKGFTSFANTWGGPHTGCCLEKKKNVRRFVFTKQYFQHPT